jgi:hypothetical protein
MKTCAKCDCDKYESEFSMDNSRPDKLYMWCKPCTRKQNRDRYWENPEACRAQSNSWRKSYPERVRQMSKDRAKTIHGRFMTYKSGASVRGINFKMTEAQFAMFWKLPCDYCGDEIRFIGLDRVDNNRGYEIDNVVPCCRRCNIAKQGMSRAVFFDMCRTITLKHEKVNSVPLR